MVGFSISMISYYLIVKLLLIIDADTQREGVFAEFAFQVFGFEIHGAAVNFPLDFIGHPLFDAGEVHVLA